MDLQVDGTVLTPLFHAIRVAILKDACSGAKGFSIAMLGAFDLIPRFLRGSVGRSTASTLSISNTSLISTSTMLSPPSSSKCSLFTSGSGFHLKNQITHCRTDIFARMKTHPTTTCRESIVTSFIVLIVSINAVILVLPEFLSRTLT